MTSALSITQSANPPRAAFLDFPLGHTAGRPNLPGEQVEIMRQALQLFDTITESGTAVQLEFSWPGDWKPAARAPIDHRTPRYDTPQYQTDADRELAIANHGETFACAACVPKDVPRE